MKDISDTELRLVRDGGSFVSVDGYTEKLMNRLHLDADDASLVLAYLKDKELTSLPDEFYDRNNWTIIHPNRDEVLAWVYRWRFDQTFNKEAPGELSVDWRDDFDWLLTDYAKKNDMWMIPLTNLAFHLASFIFVKNSLKQYFHVDKD